MTLGRDSKGAHQSKRLITEVHLSEAHENHIVKALIDNSTEKNFLSQKLVMKKEISVDVTRVSAHIIDSHSFMIYRWVACEVLVTDSEEILHCFNQSFLTADIASYDAIL